MRVGRNRKLSDDDVRAIKSMRAVGLSFDYIAERFNVTKGAVNHICRRRRQVNVGVLNVYKGSFRLSVHEREAKYRYTLEAAAWGFNSIEDIVTYLDKLGVQRKAGDHDVQRDLDCAHPLKVPPKLYKFRAGKLTRDDVRAIRWMRENGESIRSLAKKFNVGKSYIHLICQNKVCRYADN